jgi:putative ABC transport system permease protein
MLKNYLKVAFRTFARHKGYSLINLIGLSASMSVSLLIILFVKEQKSYEQFHEHKDRIFRIISEVRPALTGSATTFASSPAPLASVLRHEYPDVEAIARLGKLNGTALYNGKSLAISGLWAEPSLFQIFSFALIAGDPQKALVAPNSLVITQETAAKFFGAENPIGKILALEGLGDFTVTGLLQKPAGKTHLQSEVFASFATLPALENQGILPKALEDWNNHSRYYNYLLLAKRAAAAELETKLAAVVARFYPEGNPNRYAFRLQALPDINLGPLLANQIGHFTPNFAAYFLAGLALVLTLSAGINYVSLSVARSLKRAKEIGLRKVVGAQRLQIIKQFLIESVLFTFFALFISCLLLEWLVPQWNSLLLVRNDEMQISPDFIADTTTSFIFVAFSLVIGLLAGLYPALYLSRFMPAKVIKGLPAIKGFTGLTLRKALVVVQFAFSLIFIVSTILIYRQAEFMLEAEYGFNKENVINVPLRGVPYAAFRNELSLSPHVVTVSATSLIPGDSFGMPRTNIRREQADELTAAVLQSIDEHFIENLELTLVAGRNFSPAFSTDREQAVILNEKAVRELGFGAPLDAVGQVIVLGENSEARIVGVVQDYQFDFLWRPIGPLVLQFDSAQFRFANVRFRENDRAAALAFLEAAWRKFDRLHSFEYQFFDEQVEGNYRDFKDLIGIIGLTACLALIIACLGHLGMVSYSMEVRVKEIGIRKVLGATVSQVVLLLSKDFVKLILVAIVVATPAAWLINNLWLQAIANRVAFYWWVIGLGILSTLALAFATIGSQTIKAARANPVESLRYE